MGWRGTLVLSLLVILIGAYLWLEEPAEPEPPAEPPTLLGEPRLRDPSSFVPLVPFEPDEVTRVHVRHGELELSAELRKDGWEVSPLPQAPVAGFLQSLHELGRVMEIPASDTALSDYGLDAPASQVELTVGHDGSRRVLDVGSQNPAGTGVYVRVDGQGPVLLAGALVAWELDKLFRPQPR